MGDPRRALSPGLMPVALRRNMDVLEKWKSPSIPVGLSLARKGSSSLVIQIDARRGGTR